MNDLRNWSAINRSEWTLWKADRHCDTDVAVVGQPKNFADGGLVVHMHGRVRAPDSQRPAGHYYVLRSGIHRRIHHRLGRRLRRKDVATAHEDDRRNVRESLDQI